VLSLCFLCLIIFNLLQKAFGQFWGCKWLLHFFVLAATVSHCIAVATWFVESNASYDACSKSVDAPEQDLYPCPSDGPGLAIAQLFLMVIAAILFAAGSAVEVQQAKYAATTL
jgi:hypothetical protein